MEKQIEFTIFVGQLGLGRYSEEEKKEFLKWINEELKKSWVWRRTKTIN